MDPKVVAQEDTLNVLTQLNIPNRGATGTTGVTGPSGTTEIFYNTDESKLAYRNPEAGLVNLHSLISAKISASGPIISSTPGVSVNKPSTGIYDIIIPTQPNTNYPILTGIAKNRGNDDYMITYLNVTTSGFRICINEQDNGGIPGVPRDNEFSVLIPII